MAALTFRTGQYSVEKTASNYLKTMGFYLGKKIGQGTYSKVCLASCGDQKLACKIINRKNAGKDYVQKFLPRELQILRNLDHPNIITIHNIIDINDIVYIFMDYCKNGDLLEYIKCKGSLDESEARTFFKQIVAAVEYLHQVDLAHRDLKCENVFLASSNKIKLGDFGFARSSKNHLGESVLSDTFCGSAAYAAPEVLQGIPYDPQKIDIWALGCILYIMLSSSMPFDDYSIEKMIKLQLKRSLNIYIKTNWKNNSATLKQLMEQLLEPQVSKRATIEDIKNSAWFTAELKPEEKQRKRKSMSGLQVMM